MVPKQFGMLPITLQNDPALAEIYKQYFTVYTFNVQLGMPKANCN